MNNSFNKILPDFDEISSSQLPALVQLANMGYEYLPRHKAMEMRGNNTREYILHDIAFNALRRINSKDISDQSIKEAIAALSKPHMDNGIIKASEQIYSYLTAGCSVQEFINGKKQSPQLRFIDFENPQNNSFHATAEFEISGDASRRPDIVLFVNGIPVAVIECKKPSVPVKEAITQMLRNQQGGQVPVFFLYAQILAATNRQYFKYGTMLTPASFYSEWKIRGEDSFVSSMEQQALESQNTPLKRPLLQVIRQDLYHSSYKQEKIPLNAQNTGIFCLFSPKNLLEIMRNYIIYDNGKKKIARYQQYYAVKNILERIKDKDENGRRKGGLVWHTQGSGKSLTMVMLVKNIMEIVNRPRIIVVTDRTQLDNQIRDVFAACSIKKDVIQAESSSHLKKLIEDKHLNVITTLIHKFAEMKYPLYVDNDPDIFVLTDEAHRTQSGIGRGNMLQMLPKACVLGFTGTPLMKKDKTNSIQQFGGLIDAYTISEAQDDGAVLPLVYQGLYVNQDANTAMDAFFNQISQGLTQQKKADLMRKFTTSKLIEETSQRIEMIALSVHKHYKENFQGTGLKAQAVLPSKYAAICFKQAMDLLGGINTAVIISDSASNERESEEYELPEHKKAVSAFLAEQKRLYGSLDSYEKTTVKDFIQNPDGCEMLIVVDKLLTGFDAPADTALYLAKQLKDHNLLQAIARVNRIYEGRPGQQVKANGFIFDYSKNARNLKSALELFSNFDAKDIYKALLDTDEKIASLIELHKKMLAMFAGKDNYEECVSMLKEDETVRKEFYGNVNEFISGLSVCRALPDFYEKISPSQLKKLSEDLKRFIEIKKITHTAMAESIDFSKYEDQIRRLLNKYVTAETAEEISKPINLSDIKEFNRFIEDEKNGLSARSRAEAIASQTQKTIQERWEQDPVFYEKFSRQVKAVIEQLRIAKKEDMDSLLEQAKTLQRQAENYEDNDIPQEIRPNKRLHPYYRLLRQDLKGKATQSQISIISEKIDEIIQKEKIVDWKDNIEVKRKTRDQLEDYFFDTVKGEMGIDISIEYIDSMIENVWNLAGKNETL